MKTVNEKTWQYEKHGIDGEVELFGVNIFDYKWEDTREIAKECDFPIYKVVIDGKEYEFAAGEVSNNVWCFYLPRSSYEKKIYQCYKRIYRKLSSYRFLC